jgi:hypothetical protein
MPESPLAALSNNNDNYYAYKGEYLAKYRICDGGKHVPTTLISNHPSGVADGIYYVKSIGFLMIIIKIYAILRQLSTTGIVHWKGRDMGKEKLHAQDLGRLKVSKTLAA